MKNKIKQVNDVFDKYDPIGVQPLVNAAAHDEYIAVAKHFVENSIKHGASEAFKLSMQYIFSNPNHVFPKRDKMLDELKHAIR